MGVENNASVISEMLRRSNFKLGMSSRPVSEFERPAEKQSKGPTAVTREPWIAEKLRGTNVELAGGTMTKWQSAQAAAMGRHEQQKYAFEPMRACQAARASNITFGHDNSCDCTKDARRIARSRSEPAAEVASMAGERPLQSF